MARRLIIPSRASCILILRSRERDWALLDMFWLESIDEGHSKLQSSDRGPPCHPWLRMVYNLCMPIYEYECRKCGAHVEAFQKVNDKPLTKCRKCGGKLEKKISAPAIQFKGS